MYIYILAVLAKRKFDYYVLVHLYQYSVHNYRMFIYFLAQEVPGPEIELMSQQ